MRQANPIFHMALSVQKRGLAYRTLFPKAMMLVRKYSAAFSFVAIYMDTLKLLHIFIQSWYGFI
jgi:hypothetical protein